MMINKIKRKGDKTMYTEEIQRILRSYFENLQYTKFENLLKEMDSFLVRYHLPQLNQEQISGINGLITPNEIEAVIKSLPTKKKPRARWFHRRILPEIQTRANSSTPQTVLHNRSRWDIAKLFLRGYNHFDTQATQRYD